MLEQVVWKVLSNINTCMPGVITKYDPKTTTATVKPGFKRKYKNQDSPVSMPDISDCPVHLPRFGNVVIRPPISQILNSPCWILFSQRSIDQFMALGSPTDPLDSRKFALTDGWVIPGLTTEKNPIESKAGEESLEISYGNAYFEITQDGKFSIKNNNAELITAISELTTALKAAKTNTGIGPQPFMPDTVSKITAVEEKLTNLKGG
jgi:hypothetical protein